MKILKLLFTGVLFCLPLFVSAAEKKVDTKYVDSKIDETERKQKESNFIKDPFSRGIRRSPQFGSLSDSSFLNRPDDLRSLKDTRYYRVLGVFENENHSYKKYITINSLSESKKGILPSAFYMTLGSYKKESDAKQEAIDFLSSYDDFINHYVIVRKINKDKKLSYDVEYGPFKTQVLARSNCLFINITLEKGDLKCDVFAKHLVTENEKIAKKNVATVGLSQSAIIETTQNALGYDYSALVDATLQVHEDERIGPADFYIMRINQYGIYVANINGDVDLIPSYTLPVNDMPIDSVNKQVTTDSDTSASDTKKVPDNKAAVKIPVKTPDNKAAVKTPDNKAAVKK